MCEWFLGTTHSFLCKPSLDPPPPPSMTIKHTQRFPQTVFLSLAPILWLVGKWVNGLVTLFPHRPSSWITVPGDGDSGHPEPGHHKFTIPWAPGTWRKPS